MDFKKKDMHLLGALKESLPIPHPLGEKGLILRPGLLSWEQIEERKGQCAGLDYSCVPPSLYI